MCDCLRRRLDERRFDELVRASNLEALGHLTFDSFDSSVPGVADALQAARQFARDGRGWLILYGTFGVGKTHLAAAITNELVRRHVQVLFRVVPDLLDHLRSAFNPNNDVRYDELFELVKSASVLILDDLTEETQTPWAQEKLFQIFNHRYTYRLPTVVTTNRPLDKIDPRIRSRMFDQSLSVTVHVDARDYRHRPADARRSPSVRSTARGATRPR